MFVGVKVFDNACSKWDSCWTIWHDFILLERENILFAIACEISSLSTAGRVYFNPIDYYKDKQKRSLKGYDAGQLS